MRFFVVIQEKKVFIDFPKHVTTKWDLIGVSQGHTGWRLSDGTEIEINKIQAEPNCDYDPFVNSIIGMLCGLLMGPWGAIAGWLLGLLHGFYKRGKSRIMAEYFNKSYIEVEESDD